MAGHGRRPPAGGIVVVNSYFPKGSGPARWTTAWVGYKLDFDSRRSSPGARTPVLAPFAVGDVDVSPCKKGRLRLSFGHRRHFGL